eukprot:6966029-Prymnesium_polylepis.2
MRPASHRMRAHHVPYLVARHVARRARTQQKRGEADGDAAPTVATPRVSSELLAHLAARPLPKRRPSDTAHCEREGLLPSPLSSLAKCLQAEPADPPTPSGAAPTDSPRSDDSAPPPPNPPPTLA